MTQLSSRKKAQEGVALIITLLILVVVTSVGVVAMRAGLLQVAMATNSQVNILLFQAADAGVGALERVVTDNPNQASAATGVLGLAKSAGGGEIPLCLTKTGMTAITSTDGTRCSGSDYISGRGAVRVQMALRAITDSSGSLVKAPLVGTEAGLIPDDGGSYQLYSTSVLPVYGSASDDDVQDCLGLPQYDPVGENITDCLAGLNASFMTVVQEFMFGFSGYK